MVWPGLFLGILVAVGAGPDEELIAHLTMLRRQVEDTKLQLGRREQLAQEVATTLDRAANAASSGDRRRKFWTEAAAGLDDFNKAVPGHPDERSFSLQSAIYGWASGVSLAEESEFQPKVRSEAVEKLDEVIERLERLNLESSGTDLPALIQSIRFRYAQALLDRARLDVNGSETWRAKVQKANEVMAKPFTTIAIKGFAELLRAQLQLALGLYTEAEASLNRASVETSKPDDATLLDVRINILIALKRFGDAIAAIEASKLDPVLKNAEAIQVRVVEFKATDLEVDRARVEADALARGVSLRTSNRVEARRAVLSLARVFDDLDPNASPETFDLLAEGKLKIGQTPKAVALASRGADRATSLNEKLKAAELRSRAGAMAFQAGNWSQADALFTQVLNDPEAGTFRARAGLLIALARGRAVETRQPHASIAAYQEALERQIKQFPEDATASEARWLLGKQRLPHHAAEAYALWQPIPPTHPRWLDARLAESDDRQESIDVARAGGDRNKVKDGFDQAKQFLADCLSRAVDDTQRVELDLRRARLLLTPGIAQPEWARSIAEGWLKSSTRAEEREAARRMLVVALAEVNRLVDAEREVRELVANVSDLNGLLVPARLLDQLATDSESEITRRRIGLILKRLTDHLITQMTKLPESLRAEVLLRHARALAFSGNGVAARNVLGDLADKSRNFNDAQLRDLADAYVRTDAYELAVDVQRLRAKQTPTGSLTWFEARYGMALSYYRAGKTQQARQLIDATVLLHPELGGSELREKFERLRQRLNEK